jgi:hypothetical protein
MQSHYPRPSPSGRPSECGVLDRGLAVLGLLVDDEQWLDRVSGKILAFVPRRLLAERVDGAARALPGALIHRPRR